MSRRTLLRQNTASLENRPEALLDFGSEGRATQEGEGGGSQIMCVGWGLLGYDEEIGIYSLCEDMEAV